MSKTAQIILDQMVLVKVEATIYGARKKLKIEDLMLVDGIKLPPDDLASLGSKRLLDPDQLTVFNRLKKEAERICLRIRYPLFGWLCHSLRISTWYYCRAGADYAGFCGGKNPVPGWLRCSCH